MSRTIPSLAVVALVCNLAACREEAASTAVTGPGAAFGQCTDRSQPVYDDVRLESLYVTMRDRVRIAIDVVLPEPLPSDQRIPAILSTSTVT